MGRLGWCVVHIERIERMEILDYGHDSKEEAIRAYITKNPDEPLDNVFVLENPNEPHKRYLVLDELYSIGGIPMEAQ